MDIMKAAEVGDVDFLRKACDENVGNLESYFLGRTVEDMMSYRKNMFYRGHTYLNFLHNAAEKGQYSFLCEAMKILKSHPTLLIHLMCQTNSRGENPIHYAVENRNLYIVKLLVHAYVTAVASLDNSKVSKPKDAKDGSQETLTPPWLWLSPLGQTPLHCCFGKEVRSNECKAMYLVLQDGRLGEGRYPTKDECSTLILDDQKRSVVFKAMEAGWSLLVEHILTSDLPYNLNGIHFGERVTPLHYASKCNGKVSKLLLENHPELINAPSNVTVLHAAVEDGATWLVKLMLVGDESQKTPVRTWVKACRRLMWHRNNRGETPLHISARQGSTEIGELIIQAYASTIQDEGTTWNADVEACPDIPDIGVNLLVMKNKDGDVPLHIALRNKHDDCGVMLTKQTIPLCKHGFDDIHWDALVEAVNTGCRQSIKTTIALLFAPGSVYLLIFKDSPGRILTPAVGNIFKYLADKYEDYDKMLKSEELEKLSKVLPELVKKPVKDGKKILAEAAEKGEDWLVTLCLESDKDLLPQSAPAWQAACKNGCVSTLITFISKFGNQEFIRHCQKSQQTPLHHIKLKNEIDTDGEYLELLKNYPILEGMKNEIDTDGYTPLHRAIKRDNLELAKALLQTKGIEVSIKGNNGTKALILLEGSRKDSDIWHEQYIELLKNPRFEELKNQTDSDGATPLHRAIQREDLELTKTLLEIKGISVTIENKNGETASDLLEHRLCKSERKWHELYISELVRNPGFKKMINRTDSDGATPLHRAIEREDLELTKTLLEIKGINVTIEKKNGETASDLLEVRCKSAGKWVGYGKWHELYISELVRNPGFKKMINRTDSDGATPLHRAIEREDLELTKTLMEIKGINVTIEKKNGETTSDLLEVRCKSGGKWVGYGKWHELYISELVKNPGFKELINRTDSNEATPLHRAIEREDLELTKTLLEIKGINFNIKNKSSKTASDLLEDRCKFSRKWGKMCRKIEQDETVEKLKFIFRSIAFEGMQNNLSVVAALVATITFAAGITVPGGIDGSNGGAVLSTKAAFLVFSVSNTTAMCSSIMVLFILLGPMMWDPQPPLFYVNLSLCLLLLSLGGTMLAFMTGVYATMITKVKWNAIFILVSCSLTLFVACVILLSTYSRRFKNQLSTYSSRFKNQLHKPFEWLSGNTFTQVAQHLASGATPTIPTVESPAATALQPPVSGGMSNTIPVKPQSQASHSNQQQSGSTSTKLVAEASNSQLTANVPPNDSQSGSTNTQVTQASNIQSTVNESPSDLGSGNINTVATQVSGNPLLASPELGQLMQNKIWDAGESSCTSLTAPDDHKINIPA